MKVMMLLIYLLICGILFCRNSQSSPSYLVLSINADLSSTLEDTTYFREIFFNKKKRILNALIDTCIQKQLGASQSNLKRSHNDRIKIIRLGDSLPSTLENFSKILKENKNKFESIMVFFTGYGLIDTSKYANNCKFTKAYLNQTDISNSPFDNSSNLLVCLPGGSKNNITIISGSDLAGGIASCNPKQVILAFYLNFPGGVSPPQINPNEFCRIDSSTLSICMHIAWYSQGSLDSICVGAFFDAVNGAADTFKYGTRDTIIDAFEIIRYLDDKTNQFTNSYGDKFRSLNIVSATHGFHITNLRRK